MTAPETVVVHTDGASRGNPGPAAIGVVIAEPSGHVLLEIAEALPPTTNNVAEYTAVIRALERSRELGARRVQCLMDSQLVVRQLNGTYRVKHKEMLVLYRRVLELIQQFEEVTFAHVPRDENTEADRLANRALDVGEAPESAVVRLFNALQRGQLDEARSMVDDRFRYRRASQPAEQDADAFIAAWQGAGHWKSPSVRALGPDIVLQAQADQMAVIWICRVLNGRVASIVEYRDTAR